MNQPIFNKKWLEAEKKVDPNFKGSLAESLGLSPFLCPTCGSHLQQTDSGIICLNACHLRSETKEEYTQQWIASVKEFDIENFLKNFYDSHGKKGGHSEQH